MNAGSSHKTSGRSGRGRKAGHALKFHNFYVANERLCQSSSSSRRGERTLTHCLREEHGTKQITVSHWTTSADLTAKQDQSARAVLKTGSTSTSEGIKILPHHPSHTGQQERQQQHHQQSILQSLLANNLLSDVNQSAGSHVAPSAKVNKRKPLFVRRLLPHHRPDQCAHRES